MTTRTQTKGRGKHKKTKIDQMYELSERLKLVETEYRNLCSENLRLVALVTVARQLVRDLLQACKGCRKQIRVIDWTPQVYILTCDNESCNRFRHPISNLKKEDLKSLLGDSL